MLSLQTIHPDTLELLKTLMRLPILGQMRLVGGTSLALQYGHRRSVDLDFFGNTIEDVERLASPKDIAAMKVNAVIGRGTEKDFIDVFFLLRHYTFEQIMMMYLQKYNDGSEYRALLSMSYFEDAESQPMPYMFENVDWNTVKNRIRQEVEQYSRSHS